MDEARAVEDLFEGRTHRAGAQRTLRGSCARPIILLALLAVALSPGCSDSAGPRAVAPSGDVLGSGADPELDTFVAKLRRGIEEGDALSVDALFNWEEMPRHLVLFTRMRLLPKGPMVVTAIRLEPMEEEGGPEIELEGVTYELNVDPLGTLVVEMDDVSIGPVSKRMIVGSVGGEYRLAGMRPRD